MYLIDASTVNAHLLQLGLLDQRQQLCVSFDNTQLPYLEAYNTCLFYSALLQTGLLFMHSIIVQPNADINITLQENIFDVHHHQLSDPPTPSLVNPDLTYLSAIYLCCHMRMDGV